jgi:signal transduction histidine kinase
MGTEERPSILVVDDEQPFCTAVAQYLDSWARVVCALTYAEALQQLQQECPDILLVDQHLPDGEGLALLRFAMQRFPDTERVLITAYTEREVIQQAINELRIAYYIAKPIELPQLQLLLQQLWYTILLRRSQHELQAQIRQYYRDVESRIAERTESLQRAYEALQHLLQFREQMVRFLLHDLKAPLSNLRMLWNELRAALSAPAPHVSELLALGSDILQNLEELLQAALTAATLEQPTALTQRKAIVLSDILQHVLTSFQPHARAKQIALQLQLPETPLPSILGEPHLVERLLANLVSNALKYTPSGGWVRLSVSASDSEVCIEVTDSGQGMEPEDIEALATGTGILGGQPTAGESSTGIGLSIVRFIAELHNARLQFASAGRGRGTTVRITFPAIPPVLPAVSQEVVPP